MRYDRFRERRFLLTGLLVAASLILLGFSPGNDRVSPALQGFILGFVFFLVVPLVYCKMVLREPFSSLGFERGRVLPGFFWGLVAVVVMSGALLALDRFTALLVEYQFPQFVEQSFLGFVLYEGGVVVLTVVMYEVFFRGLVMRLWLSPVLGLVAVPVQAVLFAGLLFASGELGAAQLPFLAAGIFSGLTVYFSRSLWYGMIVSWLVVFLTDAFALIIR